eukprot:440215_1
MASLEFTFQYAFAMFLLFVFVSAKSYRDFQFRKNRQYKEGKGCNPRKLKAYKAHAWQIKTLYFQVLLHIFDISTDIGVLVEWYSLCAQHDSFNDNSHIQYDGVDMPFLFACGVIVFTAYRIMSTVFVYITTGKSIRIVSQLIDLEIYRTIYIHHQVDRKDSTSFVFRLLSKLKIIFQTGPQAILQIVYLMQTTVANKRNVSKVTALSLILTLLSHFTRFISDDNRNFAHSVDGSSPFKHAHRLGSAAWKTADIFSRLIILSMLWVVISPWACAFIVLGEGIFLTRLIVTNEEMNFDYLRLIFSACIIGVDYHGKKNDLPYDFKPLMKKSLFCRIVEDLVEISILTVIYENDSDFGSVMLVVCWSLVFVFLILSGIIYVMRRQTFINKRDRHEANRKEIKRDTTEMKLYGIKRKFRETLLQHQYSKAEVKQHYKPNDSESEIRRRIQNILSGNNKNPSHSYDHESIHNRVLFNNKISESERTVDYNPNGDDARNVAEEEPPDGEEKWYIAPARDTKLYIQRSPVPSKVTTVSDALIHLMDSESQFNELLNLLLSHYVVPLRDYKTINRKQHKTLFPALHSIKELSDKFLYELSKPNVAKLSDLLILFDTFTPFFRLYQHPVKNQENALDLLKQLAQNKCWIVFCQKAQIHFLIPLSDLLMLPSKQLVAYDDMLMSIKESTSPHHPDYLDLLQSQKSLHHDVKSTKLKIEYNRKENVHKIERRLKGKIDLLEPHR